MDPNKQIIIGFHGLAGSGKSEIAQHLVKTYGFDNVKLATGLKEMLATLYNLAGYTNQQIVAKLEGDLKEEYCSLLNYQTPRYAMQTLGTEWGRDLFGPNFWVNHWLKAIEGSPLVVVDDVRYSNEAAAIRGAGGVICHVNRPERSRKPSDHSSEVGIETVLGDYSFTNDRTLDDLFISADVLVEFEKGHLTETFS